MIYLFIEYADSNKDTIKKSEDWLKVLDVLQSEVLLEKKISAWYISSEPPMHLTYQEEEYELIPSTEGENESKSKTS